jgi:hypothetical protein
LYREKSGNPAAKAYGVKKHFKCHVSRHAAAPAKKSMTSTLSAI